MADEIRIVKHAAAQHNVVFVLGHAHAVLPKDTKIWQLPRRLILEMPYKVAAGICPNLPQISTLPISARVMAPVYVYRTTSEYNEQQALSQCRHLLRASLSCADDGGFLSGDGRYHPHRLPASLINCQTEFAFTE